MKTPKKLHLEFVRLGSLRGKLKNKMLAILPEIYKSEIWKKYAGSIVEYAGKYGDIAQTTVLKRLRLERNLEKLPSLKSAIEKVGVHKVAIIAKIATPQTDTIFAQKVMHMSKMAVQSFAKEFRGQSSPLCKSPTNNKKIELDDESTFLFMKLKAKLGKNLSDREFLKMLLSDREKREFKPIEDDVKSSIRQKDEDDVKSNIGQKDENDRKNSVGQKNEDDAKSSIGQKDEDDAKSSIGQKSEDDVKSSIGMKDENDRKSEVGQKDEDDVKSSIGQKDEDDAKSSIRQKSVTGETSRYIPIGKKREIIRKTKGRCGYPNCKVPYQVIHHRNRYSESKNHDSIIPLCRIHHEFVHNNLIKNETMAPKKWELTPITTQKINQADILYQKYKSAVFL